MDGLMVQDSSGHHNMMASHEERALKRHKTNTRTESVRVHSRCVNLPQCLVAGVLANIQSLRQQHPCCDSVMSAHTKGQQTTLC